MKSAVLRALRASAVNPMAKGLHSRISGRYLDHLVDIAALFVAEKEIVAKTARRCREDLDLPLTDNTLARWVKRSAEFMAAVEQARVEAANAEKAQPELRSPRDLAFRQQVHADLRDLYENGRQDAEGNPVDVDRDKALKQLLAVQSEIRAEEKHIADLRDREVRRDFARFLQRLVEYVKVNHARKADVIVPVFRAALKSLDSIVKGGAA